MTLVTRLRQQARQCGLHGSLLTAALLDGAAGDLEAGGVVADLLGEHSHEPAGSVPALRLAGGLHRLVLERRAPELALHYPSVGGTAPVAGVWEVAERACQDHRELLREHLRLPVQTNEVGRSAALYGALMLLARAAPLPVRLLEIGASAGLNLRPDRFGYDVADGHMLGAVGSPVRLERPWAGRPPAYDVVPLVVEAKGCDLAPVDPASTEGRLTLTSYVWADQTARLERLRAALALAQARPVVVEKAGALAFLRRELAHLPTGTLTVVWHSVVWQYVDPAEQAAVDLLLADLGSRATAQAPLARVSLEPERAADGAFVFRVHVQLWPSGERVHVADALGHGPPVRWTGSGVTLGR